MSEKLFPKLVKTWCPRVNSVASYFRRKAAGPKLFPASELPSRRFRFCSTQARFRLRAKLRQVFQTCKDRTRTLELRLWGLRNWLVADSLRHDAVARHRRNHAAVLQHFTLREAVLRYVNDSVRRFLCYVTFLVGRALCSGVVFDGSSRGKLPPTLPLKLSLKF